jgi:hypothetical protein
MAELAARLFDAKQVNAKHTNGDRFYWEMIRGLLGKRNSGRESCLLVCKIPYDMKILLETPGWRSRYGRTAAWIIDSFIPQTIPRSVRFLKCFDHIFVACQEDVEETRRRTGIPTSWLPVGTDALGLGSASGDRPYDLLRVGRQPPEWNEDAVTEEACRRRGLSFHGRPPLHCNAQENQRRIQEFYSKAKFCLAFSNLAAPAPYTHPTRDYITPRWLDAVASGATVAGVRPSAKEADLLWPEATLELNGVEREPGLDVIAEAVRDWTPEKAVVNRHMALRRLDWRWRFVEIAKVLDLPTHALNLELDEVRREIARQGQEAEEGSEELGLNLA